MLRMAALVELFAETGCEDVVTYIQSGNVVYAAEPESAKRVGERIAGAIATRHGLKVPVIVRTLREMRQVLAGNPFSRTGADPKSLHVMFLAEEPEAARVAGLDPERSPGDSYHVRGREVYLCLARGVSGSKLTNAYFDTKLGTVSTSRNWQTVLKLVAMCEEGSGRTAISDR